MGTLDDEVTALPGWGAASLPSAHYSGYLSVRNAHWHYHLTECEEPALAESAPLVLFVAGGPGGSSLSAGFKGFGQLRLDERSLAGAAYEWTGVPQLLRNEYGWARVAHVLNMDGPPGVGFSFHPNPAQRMGWSDQSKAVHSAGNPARP